MVRLVDRFEMHLLWLSSPMRKWSNLYHTVYSRTLRQLWLLFGFSSPPQVSLVRGETFLHFLFEGAGVCHVLGVDYESFEVMLADVLVGSAYGPRA